MKKIRNHMLGLMMLCVMLVTSVIPVHAAGAIDPDQDVQLTISYGKDGTAVSGAKFDIYKVADVNAYAEMTLTKRFAEYPIQFDGLDQSGWDGLATTLKGYVWADGLASDASGTTDTAGIMKTTVKPGLYLVLGSRQTLGETVYTATPFMVFLPEMNESQNAWDYEVTAYPKYSSEPVPPAEEKVSRKVLKIWDDKKKKEKRPEAITIHLLCDGKEYDTVKLTEKNDWRYTWENLEKNHDWLVTEDRVDDYTQEISQEGTTFTVKNTIKSSENKKGHSGKTDTTDTPAKTVKSADTKLPQTGLLWWPVFPLLAAGLLFIVIGLVRRRNE